MAERTIKPQWACPECAELHDSRWCAKECCPPTVYEWYVCPECKERHHLESNALDCCPPEDSDEPVIVRCPHTPDMFYGRVEG